MPLLLLTHSAIKDEFFSDFLFQASESKEHHKTSVGKDKRALKRLLKAHRVVVSEAFWVQLSQKTWVWIHENPTARILELKSALIFLAVKIGWDEFYAHWSNSLIRHKQESIYCVESRTAYLQILSDVSDHLFAPRSFWKDEEKKFDLHTVVSGFCKPWVSEATRRWVGLDRLCSALPFSGRQKLRFLNAAMLRSLCEKEKTSEEEFEWLALDAVRSDWASFWVKTADLSPTTASTLALAKVWTLHRPGLSELAGVEKVESPRELFWSLDDLGYCQELTALFVSQALSRKPTKITTAQVKSPIPAWVQYQNPNVLNNLCLNPFLSIFDKGHSSPIFKPRPVYEANIPEDAYFNDPPAKKASQPGPRQYGPTTKNWWTKPTRKRGASGLNIMTSKTSEGAEDRTGVVEVEDALLRLSKTQRLDEAFELSFFSFNTQPRQTIERALLKVRTKNLETQVWSEERAL